jgi:hypothetical protein
MSNLFVSVSVSQEVPEPNGLATLTFNTTLPGTYFISVMDTNGNVIGTQQLDIVDPTVAAPQPAVSFA